MLKDKVSIQVLKVDRRLMRLFKLFFRGKEIKSSEMSIFFEILVRKASYRPQIDQSDGGNRLSHIKKIVIWNLSPHAFSLFSFGLDGKSLRYLIINVHVTWWSKKKTILVI